MALVSFGAVGACAGLVELLMHGDELVSVGRRPCRDSVALASGADEALAAASANLRHTHIAVKSSHVRIGKCAPPNQHMGPACPITFNDGGQVLHALGHALLQP